MQLKKGLRLARELQLEREEPSWGARALWVTRGSA